MKKAWGFGIPGILPMAFFCLVWAADDHGSRLAIFDAKPDAQIEALGAVSSVLPWALGSVFENPALSATQKGTSFSATQVSLWEGENLYAVALGAEEFTGRYGGGIQWRQLAAEGLLHTEFLHDSLGNPLFDSEGRMQDTLLGTFDDISNAVIAGIGVRLEHGLYAGLSAKGVIRSLDDSLLYGGGLDAGLYFTGSERWHVGIAVKDLVPVTLGTSQNTRLLQTGAALSFWNNRLLLLAETEVALDSTRALSPAAGIQYQVAEPLFLRAGWNEESLCFGAGIRVNQFVLDYAVINHTDFGWQNPHRFTVRYFFGG